MNLRIILWLLPFSVLLGCGKAEFRKAQIDEITLSSSFTGENYQVKLLLPEGYSESQTYPIVYLLDGHFHFDELGEDLVRMYRKGEIKEVIVAGIAYADYIFEGDPGKLGNLGTIYDVRRTDLLFPKDTLDNGEIIGGGGLEFYRFLKEELAPVVESSYAVDTTQRTLMGHSYAGYFTLHQMMNYVDDPFYVNLAALSPVLWYGNDNLFYMEEAINDAGTSLPFKLYLGVGELEGMYFNATFDDFVERLEAHQLPDLNFKADRYKGGHTFSAGEGFVNALKYFYE